MTQEWNSRSSTGEIRLRIDRAVHSTGHGADNDSYSFAYIHVCEILPFIKKIIFLFQNKNKKSFTILTIIFTDSCDWYKCFSYVLVFLSLSPQCRQSFIYLWSREFDTYINHKSHIFQAGGSECRLSLRSGNFTHEDWLVCYDNLFSFIRKD